MMQPLYILAASAISPQASFSREHFLKPVRQSNNCRLYALEAPFEDYISPVAIRRMSRVLKMAISTSMQALHDAGVKTPDAIITGTGRGSVTDMETMVHDLFRLEEGPMNPTAFIQSTYNSPNGWIAKQSNCNCYNQTYVHRGCSFELALLDAQMLAAESEGPVRMLVGCYDELTEEYFTIRGHRGYWKEGDIGSRALFEHQHSRGSIAGEGAAAFVLSNMPGASSIYIAGLRIVQHSVCEGLAEAVAGLLEDSGCAAADISMVLTGLNGDREQAELYSDALKIFNSEIGVGLFKHLCGDFDTAIGFGLWLANELLTSEAVPEELLLQGIPKKDLTNILLLNHFVKGTASAILLQKTKGEKG